MDDYETGRIESGTDRAGSRLGGLSLQTGASILLIAVIAAVLFLFLGPMPDGGSTSDLPTATPTRLAAGLGGGTPVTSLRPPVLGGTAGAPVLGAPVGATPLGGPAAAGTPAGGIGFTSTEPLAVGTPAAAAGVGIRPGAFVSVAGTGIYGLRLRFGPGTDTNTIRIVNDDEILLVTDESTQEQGATWRRVQDLQGNVGWVTEEFLRTGIVAPASWAPPAASPTFPAPGPGTAAP